MDSMDMLIFELIKYNGEDSSKLSRKFSKKCTKYLNNILTNEIRETQLFPYFIKIFTELIRSKNDVDFINLKFRILGNYDGDFYIDHIRCFIYIEFQNKNEGYLCIEPYHHFTFNCFDPYKKLFNIKHLNNLQKIHFLTGLTILHLENAKFSKIEGYFTTNMTDEALLELHNNGHIKLHECCTCYELCLTKSPCDHNLCYTCFDKIMDSNPSCPYCRKMFM